MGVQEGQPMQEDYTVNQTERNLREHKVRQGGVEGN